MTSLDETGIVPDSLLGLSTTRSPLNGASVPMRGGMPRASDVLVTRGYATREQIDALAPEARANGQSVEQLLVDRGIITAEQRAVATAERLGMEFVDLSQQRVDLTAVALLPVEIARRGQLVPIGRTEDGRLRVAMADPTNVVAIDDVEIHTGLGVEPVVATLDDVLTILASTTRMDSAVSQVLEEDEQQHEAAPPLEELQEAASETPVVKLVNSLLAQAVTEGASDIHFEAGERDMRVRLRVDGVMRETARVPARMVPSLVSRVKIMCELDISERRVPQDGRLGLVLDTGPVDIRVVTLPTVHGESIVMRLLDRSAALIELDGLGLGEEPLARLRHAIGQANGSLLVTGPTGSGKSTTLYAILNTLNRPDRNIVTIEDPVEYQLAGVNQIPVNSRSGLTFASGLRSMMRADPDIIMVGEIRDRETAQISIEAALTGHLLLSTLHTNDAPGAITRLVEMGIEPFLVASSVGCIIAQRLARTLCTSCKRPVRLEAEPLRRAGFDAEHDVDAFEPGGCARCGGGGFRGRVGLYEVMPVSPALRELALANASSAKLGAAAREEGMRTLREDAFEKVGQGLTSIDEVMRVLGT